MRLKNLFLLIGIIVVLGIAGTFFYYSFYNIVDVKQVDYYFNVANKAGLVGDTNALRFGTIPPGSTGKRDVQITNTYDMDLLIRFEISGEKSEWVAAEKNNFILPGNNKTNISIFINPPAYAPDYENYTGTLKAYFLRP